MPGTRLGADAAGAVLVVRTATPLVIRSASGPPGSVLGAMLASAPHVVGRFRAVEGPIDRFVFGAEAAEATSDDPGMAEVAALRARRAGLELKWAEPIAVERVSDLITWNRSRGRSSVSTVRNDRSLLTGLQSGAWFCSGWWVRANRRVILATPGAGLIIKIISSVPAAHAVRVAADLAFWSGVRTAATRAEWRQLTRESYVTLCDHRLAGEGRPGQERMDVPPRVFRSQIRVLRLLGFQALSVNEVLAFHRGHSRNIGRKRYVLTADDGDRSASTIRRPTAERDAGRRGRPGGSAWNLTRRGRRCTSWSSGPPLSVACSARVRPEVLGGALTRHLRHRRHRRRRPSGGGPGHREGST